jgi:hypothetical protein
MEILAALHKSPLPNLLVIGGFLLILIGFVGKISGYVELSQKRQIWAAILGLMSLGFGTFLFAFNPNPTPKSLPISDLSPTEPKVEVDLGRVRISPLDSSGIQWCAEISAEYAIEYESGAYSVWGKETGCEGNGCWSTAVYVYKNRKVEWTPQGGDYAAGNPDFEIGWQDGHVKKEDAEIIARAGKNRFETKMDSGDCLTFITTDGKSDYGDNIGEIIVRVKIIGQ